MAKIFFTSALLLLISSYSHANDEVAELRQLVLQLTEKVQAMSNELNGLRAQQQTSHSNPLVNHNNPSTPMPMVDLSADEIPAISYNGPSHVLANPWWENIEIYGFGAVGAYNTGPDSTRDDWGFEVKEFSLFIEANVWENTDAFIELQTNRLGADDSKFTRTGEVYLHFRDVPVGNSQLGFKLGRIDIPFGEEYLWQDSFDNPLITNSAAYPYGWDEGILTYGEFNKLHWIFAITDGTDQRSEEDNSDKAFNAKFYGDVTEDLYLSMSLMKNGKAAKSAIEFGGSHFQPVGAGDTSALVTSTSMQVDARLIELDAKYSFTWDSLDGYLAVTLGGAQQEDANSTFDRDFRWFSLEPYLQLNENWYTVLRYSEIGTYDNNEGFHFDGKTFAGGNSAFGYEVERFQRFGIGLGWTPNPHVKAKFEIGNDWFDLIDNTVKTKANDREFIAFEMAVKF